MFALVQVAFSAACAAPHPPQGRTEPAREPESRGPVQPVQSAPVLSVRPRAADLASTDAGVARDAGPHIVRPDAEIVRDIERAIAANGVLTAQGNTVRVTCEKGEVTLRGSVKDEAARASVTSTARHTPGVTRIQDLLKPIDPHPVDWHPEDPNY
jgi:hypothetical protein